MNGTRLPALAAVVFCAACADVVDPLGPAVIGMSEARRAADIRIIDLGTLGGSSSSARGINTPAPGRRVLIVGEAKNGAGQQRAAYWYYDITSGTHSAATALVTAGDMQSTAHGVNMAEQISGWSYSSEAPGTPTKWISRAVRWTPSEDAIFLGDFGGGSGQSSSIDSLGRIIGFATASDGARHAFRWDPDPAPEGTLNNLGFSGNDLQPGDMNKSGTIVGSVRPAAGGLQTAFVWRAGAMMLLPDFGPQPPGDSVISSAVAVNDSGVIVGMVNTVNFRTRAVRWNPTADGGYVVQDLGLGTGSSAKDINNRGEIVGSYTKRRNLGFYLFGSTLKELPILSYAAGAFKINEQGDIIGFSYYRNTYMRAVLWTNVRDP